MNMASVVDFYDAHDWNDKVLLFKDNTYLIPIKTKILIKRIKDIEM
jgi:hypothetical protein